MNLDCPVLIKKDYTDETFTVYFSKGDICPILDGYGGTTLVWNDGLQAYKYIPKSHYYSVEDTLKFMSRKAKIKILLKTIRQ